jgi:hypothetical protein
VRKIATAKNVLMAVSVLVFSSIQVSALTCDGIKLEGKFSLTDLRGPKPVVAEIEINLSQRGFNVFHLDSTSNKADLLWEGTMVGTDRFCLMDLERPGSYNMNLYEVIKVTSTGGFVLSKYMSEDPETHEPIVSLIFKKEN